MTFTVLGLRCQQCQFGIYVMRIKLSSSLKFDMSHFVGAKVALDMQFFQSQEELNAIKDRVEFVTRNSTNLYFFFQCFPIVSPFVTFFMFLFFRLFSFIVIKKDNNIYLLCISQPKMKKETQKNISYNFEEKNEY